MLTVTMAQLKSDITPMLKGTSLRQVTDFYGTAAKAANRMLARISPIETRRTATFTTPFWDNVNDYALPTDFKQGIDIRPQANRQDMPGSSDWSATTPKQFNIFLSPDSYSIRWNNMIRTLRAQRLPAGNVITMDTFDVTISGSNAISNGTWTPEGDASGLYVENLNYVQGNGCLGMNLSGVSTTADIVNTTATVTDLSALRYQDTSFIWFYIPVGYSSRFTSFTLRRGSSASAYKQATVTTKADGTAFTDGWNFLMFSWNTATTVGSPDDTQNTYRRFGINYTAGTTILGCLIDNWTDSLGTLYEVEYYSEYMFRTSAGAWIQSPTADTDLVNVSVSSYPIFLQEMMLDITKLIRIGNQRSQELAEIDLELNGKSESRYLKNPAKKGAYANYLDMFPSSAILTRTQYYNFDC
jgi:hypothetical protein